MAGPATAVVAGLITAWLAVRSNDGLVVDDYYRQGLAINRTVSRSAAAERLGIRAQIFLADDRIRVLLGTATAHEALSLRFVHPTRSGMDQSVDLTAMQPGEYGARLRPLAPGRWHVVLEGNDWRLAGDWTIPAADTMTLGGGPRKAVAADTAKEGKQ